MESALIPSVQMVSPSLAVLLLVSHTHSWRSHSLRSCATAHSCKLAMRLHEMAVAVVATAVVAKWEKVFDYEKMNKFILDKNNKNDLKEIKELKPKKRLEFNYAENDDYIIR